MYLRVANFIILLSLVESNSIIEPRIVNGSDTNSTLIPYQVQVRSGLFFCGGAIISPSIVLSAGHCVYLRSTRRIRVIVGRTFREYGGIEMRIKYYIVHERYRSFRRTMDNDIAALFLANELIFDDTIQPVKLPEPYEELPPDTIVQVSGWGALSENGDAPNQLQVVEMPIWNRTECSKVYLGRQVITMNMICAGHPEGGRDSCQGDSGGPMVTTTTTTTTTLIGLVSFGYGCGRPNNPGVYTKISVYREWIRRFINS